MDNQKIGKLIYTLRKNKNMTQKEVGDSMNISDKAVSKWERGLGCPDVSILPLLADTLGVNIECILTGELNSNEKSGGSMKNIKFYVCEKCGNLITSNGDAVISCCSQNLSPLEAKKADDAHALIVEKIDDELYITTNHPMEKEHFISFMAFQKGANLMIEKKYPEWNLDYRLRKRGYGKLYYYCTNHGLFYVLI